MREEEEERRTGNELEIEEFEEDKINKASWKRFLALFRNESLTGEIIDRYGNGSSSRSSSRSYFIIRPDNWWYAVWTHFILIWAIYSSFFTPFEFGFFRGLPQNLFLLDSAGQIAFLIDIVVHFCVAFRDLHSYRWVYNRNLIAIRYLKSRFLVDLLGCLPWDAIYKACGRKEAVRYMLWIRLSRACRVTELFERLEKDIRINYLLTRIVKLFVVELYCTHTAACIFYYLATTLPPSEEGYTWIGSLQLGDYHFTHFRDIDLWKRYITSLYFAIVTMATVGYGEIHAVNVREMIFVMIYVSFDMILGAYLLGNMTALIVRGSKTEKFRDKMTDLIKYMNRNNIGKSISNDIKGHLRLQYDRSYTETTLLQGIPSSIRAKISQKLYEPYISQVPLFKGCSSGFIKQIAIKVHEEFFIPGEVITEQGQVVDQLYVVCYGELVKEEMRGEDVVGELPMHLQTYSSFGEVSFLCNTPQPYTVRVRELCRVLRLDKRSFTEILDMFFFDGRIVLNNFLEGKDSNLKSELLESDITLYIEKSESVLASRLNCATYDGDFFRLKRLVGAGADPNNTDYDGRSPLHIAASKGYQDITLFLIEQGTEVNIADKFGNTPLLEAVKNGHDEVASTLVGAGATLEIDDAGGFLCMAVARKDLDLLKRALLTGINPNAKNFDCRAPLHVAASEGLYSIASLLLEAGASVLSKDRWGHTPLDEAYVGGDKNLIRLLEVATTSQTSGFSDRPQQIEGRKCTIFPFHPWDPTDARRHGVVLWVPHTLEELVKAAMEKLESSSSCILSENGGKILDVNMISDGQKLYLVSET
ncbi:potassium channel SKOR-like isoform X1 [Euphorbia lathyris]|uniref:potassium channel SKOR-like isoform X1 n=1 Tax=Euphorbia lathyris TaxID=212925 RepID=UPI0033136B6E